MPLAQNIVRRIEGLESVDRVARPLAARVSRATASTPVRNALSGTWLGHPLHPMLTDLPIGAWVMAELLDLTAGRAGTKASRRLVGAGIAAALPTAAAGLADWSDSYGPDERVGLAHAMGNVAAVSLQVGSYLCRRRGHRALGVALSSVALGTMTVAAYLGGHLSYSRGLGVSHTAFEEPVADWVDVASLHDLDQEGQLVRVTAKGTPVMLVRRGDDVRALSATCVHASGPLDEGKVLDGAVRCPWHGSIFRIADGKVLRGPASTTQPKWDVRIEGQRVHVRSSTR